jgi:hypothetical protein
LWRPQPAGAGTRKNMKVPISLLTFALVVGIVFNVLGVYYLHVPQIVVYAGSAALTGIIILEGRAIWARLFSK